MSVLITGISYEASENSDNFFEILNHFDKKFSENNFEVEVSTVVWQPKREMMNFPSQIRFYLTWVYSYILFFSSSKKRFVKARTFAATFYFMIRKLIKLDAETSGRSNPEYMYLDQQLTAKHFQAMASFLDSSHDYMLLVCDDVKMNIEQAFEMHLLTEILSSSPQEIGLFVELAPFYEMNQLARDFNYRINSQLGEHWYEADFFANTAACYLINRRTAEIFTQKVFENPLHRTVSIDWILTYIGTHLKAGEQIDYWTRFPSSYLNSSLYSGSGGLVGEGDAKVPTTN
jgi:hypothetical protein